MPVNPPWPPPTCGGRVELWAKLPNLDAGTRFRAGPGAARLAELGQDPKSGVTAAQATTFAEEAVTALRDAISAGWAQRDDLKEPDFDPLRGREDFKKLVAELEAKHGPKAKQTDGSP